MISSLNSCVKIFKYPTSPHPAQLDGFVNPESFKAQPITVSSFNMFLFLILLIK